MVLTEEDRRQKEGDNDGDEFFHLFLLTKFWGETIVFMPEEPSDKCMILTIILV